MNAYAIETNLFISSKLTFASQHTSFILVRNFDRFITNAQW